MFESSNSLYKNYYYLGKLVKKSLGNHHTLVFAVYTNNNNARTYNMFSKSIGKMFIYI